MSLPKPPWYGKLQKTLDEVEWLPSAILVLVILVSLYMLWRGDSVIKTLWAVYLISP